MSNKKMIGNVELARGERLRHIRKLAGMTVEAFAEACGAGRTTISYWEKGVNGLSKRGAQKIVRAMCDEGISCTTLWLLQGIGEPPKIADPAKLSRLHYKAALPIELQSSVREALPVYSETRFHEEMQLFKKLHTAHLICNINDHSMLPVYQPGDWVGGALLSADTVELAHGKDCIIHFKENDLLMVRRVQVEGIQADRLSFYVINAEYSLKYPPLYQFPANAIMGIAPISHLWRALPA